MRRLLALAALVTMAVAPPALLATLGHTDWTSIHLWGGSDVRVLLLALTALGWLAWAAWMVAFLVELVVAVSGRRLRPTLPGLGAPRALASALIGAVLVAGVSSAAHAEPTSPRPLVAEAAAEGELVAATVPEAPAPSRLVHRVQVGDDLWSLAEHYYGDGAQWRQVVEANPALRNDPFTDLPPGMELTIPTPVSLVTVKAGGHPHPAGRRAPRRPGPLARDPRPEPRAHLRSRPDPRRVGPQGAAGRASYRAAVPRAGVLGAGVARAGRPRARPPARPPRAGPLRARHSRRRRHARLRCPPADRLAPASADQSDAGAVTGLVGGMSALTASAVLGGIGLRRRVQAQARPLGRRYVQPVGDLARYEAALGHARAEEPEPGRDHLLARAMRRLSAHWWAERQPAPTLRMAVLGPDVLEFEFATAPGSAPPGFACLDSRLSVSWAALRGEEGEDHPVAYPALVTLGEDAEGRLLMIDVMAAGVLGVRPDGGNGAAEVLSAMLVELSCSPWADELDLLVVTPDPAFAAAASEGRVVCERDVEAGLAAVQRLLRRRSVFIPERGWDAGRLDPDLADAWSPQVVLFEAAPDASQLARLTSALDGNGCGVAAIAVVDTDADADWTLSSGPAGGRRVDTADARATPQTVPAATRQALTGLFEVASRTTTQPASWWAAPPTEDDVNIIALRPGFLPTPSGGPRLGLLGPIELSGCAGDPPPRALRQCIEYCAWLHLNPGSTAVQMTRSLLVADGTRRSNMSRLRTWLGSGPDGELYLPDAYSGRITLHDDVTSDWHDLTLLTSGGVNRQPLERLVRALELVRGAPLADAAPGQWGWAEEFRADAGALVRDVGVVASRAARERGDLETARWAANRALLAAPDDELLLGERIRTEQAAGRLDEVHRLVQRVTRTARVLGVDLLPETVEVCQQAIEGRLRARA